MADSLSSISGISSGIDTKSLVDQIITLERRPAVALQAKIDDNTKRKSALSDVQTALAALQTAADALKTGTPFESYSVTASGADASGKGLVVATASSGASNGNYALIVQQLAAGQKTIATVGASSTAALGASGTFAINGQNVDVTDTDTLAQVRDKINALTVQSGVRATIVTGGPTDARLILNSTATGAAAAFTVSDVTGTVAGTTLGLSGPPSQTAQDAQFTIDGVSVSRATNTVTDAIPGVTVTLNAADPTRTATLAVERFKNTATDAVKTFVDAYNKVRSLVTSQSASNGALRGDALLRTITGSLSTAVLNPDGALPGDMASLGAAGISLQKDGTLAVDSTKLSDAYGGRLDDLRALFTSRMGGVSTYLDSLTQAGTGVLAERGTSIDGQSARMTTRISDLDARLDKKRTSLLAQYAKFEASLGRLKSIGDSLTAQITGMNAKSNS